MSVSAPSLPFFYNDFHGGFNSLQNPYLLTDNQARDVSNVQGTTAGAIVKRNGLVTFATPAQALTSLFPLEAVSPTLLIGAGSTNLYSISTAGSVSTIKTGLTSGKRWEFVSAPITSTQGPLFGMNGTDAPVQGNAGGTLGSWTATDAGGTLPNGTFCLYFGNQVFVSGVAAQPSRVYWSGIGDPTAWNPANLNGSGFMDFDPGDGQAISGIATVGPYVLVAKPRKLWVITSVATASARKLSDDVGVAAHRSIASAAEGTYFLAEDRGVYLTNGSSLKPMADVIQPTIDSMQSGLRSQAVGTYFNAHYYLSLPIATTTNDTLLDFDVKLQSWWRHTIGSNDFAIWHPSGQAQLFSAKSTSAIVDQCFAPGVFTDNAQKMTWKWSGPWQSPSFYRRRRFPTPYFRKRLRQVRFEGFGTVDFSLAKDFAGLESLVRSNAFGYPGNIGTWADSGTFGDPSTTFAPGFVQRARIQGGMGVASAFSIVFGATSDSADAIFEYMMALADRRDQVVA